LSLLEANPVRPDDKESVVTGVPPSLALDMDGVGSVTFAHHWGWALLGNIAPRMRSIYVKLISNSRARWRRRCFSGGSYFAKAA
jgi:hypothetical protein